MGCEDKHKDKVTVNREPLNACQFSTLINFVWGFANGEYSCKENEGKEIIYTFSGI